MKYYSVLFIVYTKHIGNINLKSEKCPIMKKYSVN